MVQSTYEKRQITQMVQRAVQHATAGTSDSTDKIYRLPVELYSPRSWEEEMNAIFRRLPLWRFGTDGALLAVADPRKFGEVDRSQRDLVELPCEERVGFVWVCITPGRVFDLDQYLGGMLDELTCLEADKWFLYGTSSLESANWKITHDGYLDVQDFRKQQADAARRRSLPVQQGASA